MINLINIEEHNNQYMYQVLLTLLKGCDSNFEVNTFQILKVAKYETSTLHLTIAFISRCIGQNSVTKMGFEFYTRPQQDIVLPQTTTRHISILIG